MPDLKAQLDGITQNIPEEIGARIAHGVADLAASGVAPGLAVGATAPDFSLPDAFGNHRQPPRAPRPGSGGDHLLPGGLVPVLQSPAPGTAAVPGRDPGAGATLVAISAQAPDHASDLIQKHELDFPVLSDLDQSVSEAYRVRFDLNGELEDLQVNVFQNDPAAQNADGRRSLPVASTFVVDTDHVVRFASVDADWRNRVEPADVIAVVAGL